MGPRVFSLNTPAPRILTTKCLGRCKHPRNTGKRQHLPYCKFGCRCTPVGFVPPSLEVNSRGQMKEVPGRLASEHTSDRTFSLQSCRTQRKLFQRASEGIYFRPGSIQFKVLRLEKEEG